MTTIIELRDTELARVEADAAIARAELDRGEYD